MVMASELIESLNRLIEKHGDLPVLFTDDDEGDKSLELPVHKTYPGGMQGYAV